METDHIDELLERYLSLLDEYATLRETLNKTQSGMYQNIALANFSAERGFRYGQDCYDGRMQATRTLGISKSKDDLVNFRVANLGEKPEQTEASETNDKDDQPADEKSEGGSKDDEAPAMSQGEQSASSDSKKADEGEKTDASTTAKPKDPLRWFGVLTPMPLRQAQAQATTAVEKVIPRLVTVNSQMLEIEIQIRRARKKRAKAEVSAKKDKMEASAGETVKAI